MSKENKKINYCRNCNVKLEPDDTLCCTCVDDTEGRTQHFFQIKYENRKEVKNESKNNSKKTFN